MSNILNTEINRLLIEIGRINLMIDTYQEFKKIPHYIKCLKLLKKIYNILNSKKEYIKNTLTENIPEEQAIKNINDFRYKIKTLTNYFYSVIINTQEIPRELYHLCDIYMTYFNEQFNYIIFISDEIAMTSIKDILNYINFQEMVPNLFIEIESNFYFIMIIQEYGKTEASLNWPIILHEIAHCIIKNKNIDNTYIGYITVEEAIKTVIGHYIENIDTPIFLLLESRRKLLITEHLADLFVTITFGPIYGWRFIEELLTLLDVLEYPITHPASDKRIDLISSELSDMDMNENAEYLKESIKVHQDMAFERANELNLEPEINNAIRLIKEITIYKINKENIIKSIKDSRWSKIYIKNNNVIDEKTIYNLHNKMILGNPIIIEPPILYYLIIIDFSDIDNVKKMFLKDKFSQARRNMIADIIRMYYIQNCYIKGS